MTRAHSLILAAALACVLPAAAQAAPKDTRQCLLGRMLLDEAIRRSGEAPPLLDEAPVIHFPLRNPSPAPGSLAEGWSRLPPSNIFTACPRLKADVASKVRFATEEDRADVKLIPAPRRLYILSFPAPLLNAAGTEAVAQSSDQCPGLCGGAVVARYQWRNGAWVKAETLALIVS